MDQANVWLRDGVDGTAYFPEEDGSFSLHAIDQYTTLDVEGPELVVQQSGSSSSMSVAVDSSNSRPAFKSVIPAKKMSTHSIKVRVSSS